MREHSAPQWRYATAMTRHPSELNLRHCVSISLRAISMLSSLPSFHSTSEQTSKTCGNAPFVMRMRFLDDGGRSSATPGERARGNSPLQEWGDSPAFSQRMLKRFRAKSYGSSSIFSQLAQSGG